MQLQWTSKAQSDLKRIYDFIRTYDVKGNKALEVIRSLMKASENLCVYPHVGSSLESFGERDVRRFLVGDYELRYEITENDIFVLRVWHTREDR